MAAKIVSGARALVSITDPNTGKQNIIGIWNSFSYSVTYDVIPAYVLGRFSPASLQTVAVEPVTINCSGYRIVDHSLQKEGSFVEIANLLFQEYVTLSVLDRQTNKAVATITGCIPNATSASFTARQLVEGSVSYTGLLYADEQFVDNEAPDAASLP